MDKIAKLFQQLSKKERLVFLLLIERVKLDYTKVVGLRKLANHKDLYRARIGDYRLIFRIDAAGAELIRISKRDENIYKNL